MQLNPHKCTVKLWIEALRGLHIVLIPGLYPGPSFYQSFFEVVNFCSRCISIWQLLQKVNVAWKLEYLLQKNI